MDDGTGAVRVEGVSKRESAGSWTPTTDSSASDGVRMDDVLAEFESFPSRAELEPDEEPTEAIGRVHHEHGIAGASDSFANAVDTGRNHGERRYSEQVIEPGEDVYVLGRATARDDPDRTRVRLADAVITRPEDGLFVVSDQDAASLAAALRSAARLRLAGGAVLTVLGVAGFAYLLWPSLPT